MNQWEKEMMNITIGKKVLKLVDVLPDLNTSIVKSITDRARDKGVQLEELPLIRKYYPSHIKEVNKDERTEISAISTITEDRDREIMYPKGVDKKNYEKNPVVLCFHDYHAFPVGKNLWLKVGDQNILGKTRYTYHEVANTVWSLYLDDIPLGKSIGFIPWERIERATDEEAMVSWMKDHDLNVDKNNLPERIYTKWELLEYSVVPVPANPECVTLMVSKSTSPLMTKYFQGFDFKAMKEVALEELEGVRRQAEADKSKETGKEEKNADAGEEKGEKTGAVLNRKNKAKLEQAKKLLTEVIESAEDDDEGKGAETENKDDKNAKEASDTVAKEIMAKIGKSFDEITAKINTLSSKIESIEEKQAKRDAKPKGITVRKEPVEPAPVKKGIMKADAERMIAEIKETTQKIVKETIENHIKRNIKGEMS